MDLDLDDLLDENYDSKKTKGTEENDKKYYAKAEKDSDELDDLWGAPKKPTPKQPQKEVKKQEQVKQRPTTAGKPQKKEAHDPWASSGGARKKSPAHDIDDFDFMDDKKEPSVFDKSPAPKHMPTFGIKATTSQKSGSKKKDEEEDEFDNILDSIVGKDDVEDRKIEEDKSARKRKPIDKRSSMQPFEPSSLQGSAKKMELDNKKRALFGISGGSDEKKKLNFGARSQIAPDDGSRGIGTTFDKDNTNSSIGHQQYNQANVIDSSPIGVIATSNSRRMVQRKTPSQGGNSLPRPQQRAKTADIAGRNDGANNRFDRNVVSPPNFDNRPETSNIPDKKPPRPVSQPQIVNKAAYDDDDSEFARDDDQEILDLMGVPDKTPEKSSTQHKQVEIDEEDVFSGNAYIPSTLSKGKDEDTKSKLKYGDKSDVSNEATPIPRGRKPITTAINKSDSKQRDSRDSFSPPEIIDSNFVKDSVTQNKQRQAQDVKVTNVSKVGVIPKETSNQPKPLDEVGKAKLELEEERANTAELESKLKREVEQLRSEQKKDIQDIESHHNKIIENHNKEIKRLVDEMNQSIKQEREKLELINQTEVNSKKKQQELELSKQKDIYSSQHSIFENQLKQQIELLLIIDC